MQNKIQKNIVSLFGEIISEWEYDHETMNERFGRDWLNWMKSLTASNLRRCQGANGLRSWLSWLNLGMRLFRIKQHQRNRPI